MERIKLVVIDYSPNHLSCGASLLEMLYVHFFLTAAFQICILSPLTWFWLSILKLFLGFHLRLFFHISDSRLWECDTRSKCFTKAMVRTALKDKSTSEGSVQASVSLLVFFFLPLSFFFWESLSCYSSSPGASMSLDTHSRHVEPVSEIGSWGSS